MDNADNFADLSNLDADKIELLSRTIKPILASAVAEDTFAQIIDGQPTRPSYKKNYSTVWDRDVSERMTPTDASVHQYAEIKDKFSPLSLKLDIQLVQAFQRAPKHTRDEDLRLLEIVAASLHSLAAMIYTSFHPDTDLNPPDDPNDHRFHMTSHFWVDFYHPSFKLYWRYPYGLLNVVGYWAESQILGGVLLFERGASGLENKNAFVEPQGSHVAYQLSSEQITRFASIGRRESPLPSNPETELLFQMSPTKDARVIESWQMHTLQIYKNKYDMTPYSQKPRKSCVIQWPPEMWEAHFSILGLPVPESYRKPIHLQGQVDNLTEDGEQTGEETKHDIRHML